MPEPSSTPSYLFKHRTDIQNLRGIAVILVVLYHAQEVITGGYVGVDVFFVISGFVIAAGIFRELDRREGKFSFRSFYERRMRRLLPSLSVTVLLTLVAGLFLSPYASLKFLRRTGLAATFFNGNHYLYRNVDYSAPSAERNALLHTWSLSVEEQFYFVFPLLFVLAATFALRGKRRFYHTVGVLMGAVFALSFVAELYFSYTSASLFGLDMKRAAFFLAPLRAWEFGAGVLLATALPWMQRVSHVWVGRALSITGTALIIACALFYNEGMLFPGVLALLPVIGTAMLLVSGSLASTTQGTTIVHRALTKIGDLSYGWYLWHWPLLVFVQASWPGDPWLAMWGALLVSLAMAKLNELAIESPIRHATWVKSTRSSLLILLVCFALPVAGFMVQKLMVPRFQQHPEVQRIDTLEKDYAAIGCQGAPYAVDQTSCRWGEPKAPWRVVLIGDSNARQFIPALSQVVPALGGEFHASTMSSCFVTDLKSMRMGTEYDVCTAWLDATLTELTTHPPDVILISSAYDNYLSNHTWSLAERDHTRTYKERAALLTATQESVARLTKRLTNTGAKVGFIKPIPKFRHHSAFLAGAKDSSVLIGSDCSLVKLMYFPSSCNASRPLKETDAPQWLSPEYGREAYRTALDDRAFEIVIDQEICPDNTCEARRDGRWVYRDTQHLSPHGAIMTSPALERALRPLRPETPGSGRTE